MTRVFLWKSGTYRPTRKGPRFKSYAGFDTARCQTKVTVVCMQSHV